MDRVLLEPEQEELLMILVEAARSQPRSERQSFSYIEGIGHPHGAVRHPGVPNETRCPRSDIEILANEGLLILNPSSRGIILFDITPQGSSYYETLKEQQGESVERVEATVRQYLEGNSFQSTYPLAYKKWREAEDILWSSDSEKTLTTIGHLCREAIQEFADELVKKYKPDTIDPDKAHTVSRLRAVIAKVSHGRSEAELQFLDTLIHFWGSVIDMVQRQEHGTTKVGKPLVWEDARRVVFQTVVVMFEISKALD